MGSWMSKLIDNIELQSMEWINLRRRLRMRLMGLLWWVRLAGFD
jgi:hypothetical protein